MRKNRVSKGICCNRSYSLLNNRGNKLCNVQPVIIDYKNEEFALAHNGNIINALDLASQLSSDTKLTSTSDTEIMGWVIRNSQGKIGKKRFCLLLQNFKVPLAWLL